MNKLNEQDWQTLHIIADHIIKTIPTQTLEKRKHEHFSAIQLYNNKLEMMITILKIASASTPTLKISIAQPSANYTYKQFELNNPNSINDITTYINKTITNQI